MRAVSAVDYNAGSVNWAQDSIDVEHRKKNKLQYELSASAKSKCQSFIDETKGQSEVSYRISISVRLDGKQINKRISKLAKSEEMFCNKTWKIICEIQRAVAEMQLYGQKCQECKRENTTRCTARRVSLKLLKIKH